MVPEKKASINTRVRPPLFSFGRQRTESERDLSVAYIEREVGYTHLPTGVVLFGLMIGNKIGYMSYPIDEAAVNRTSKEGLFFDAGTTMPEIYVSAEELTRAYEELGLLPWKEDDSNA